MPKTVGHNHITATARLSSTQEIIGSDSLTVTVVPGAPNKATVWVDPDNVLSDGVSTYVVTVTNVTDKYGNAIDQTPLTVTVQSPGRYVVSSGTTANGTLALVMTSTIKAGVHPIVVEGKNGPLTISGDTDDYTTVDSIENALKASSYFSSVKSPSSDRDDKTGRIKFDMILERAM